MGKSKVLLVVEGEKVEKELFEHFYSLYGMQDVEIVAYRTNIYAFYNRLRNDFGDTDGKIVYDYIDLPLFLNDYLGLEGDQLLNDYDFKDKILIFDYDPHDPQYSLEKLEELLSNFSNSTELGKLYLNYPMVESYNDLSSFNEDEFINYSIHIDLVRNRRGKISEYKAYVDSRTCIKNIKDIDNEIANLLFKLHSKKFCSIVGIDECDGTDGHVLLCKRQSENLEKNELIWVINTGILHLYDEYGFIK
ncbi:hypothetical protein [Lysinibacillus endophyticus]|uniref:Uncharacterized protein n=1 Tax=Ureibacillus endophyticus TaxID=1978490 RepID=A0A494YUY1_9BACL|nr:hypothetical protein [Lysinibacillus endophyticus]MCP1144562.1 hypothetical protein [Lysinibacillus endophyticus]RKQ13975.1 hypothetical protein D8M03_15000 [Lysinibacillus endophyticus]